jgi:purine-binding chemotaxis protein CheW
VSGHTQFVTFAVDGLLLGLPVGDVQEVLGPLPVTPVPRAGAHVAGLMNLRGQVITAIDLRTQFGLPAGPHGSGGNVLARTGAGPVALVVDRVGDVVEVTDAAFETAPATLAGHARTLIVGAYKLPDALLLHLALAVALAPVPGPP